MKAILSCNVSFEDFPSYVFLPIDENTYDDSVQRTVTATKLSDGGAKVTDGGFAEGNREIRLTSLISYSEFETLEKFQETSNSKLVFGYKTKVWQVVLRTLRKENFGNRCKATLTLSVSRRLTDDGLYFFYSSSSSSSSVSYSSSSSSSSA